MLAQLDRAANRIFRLFAFNGGYHGDHWPVTCKVLNGKYDSKTAIALPTIWMADTMLNIIMMVPDSLFSIEAVNSPKWAEPVVDTGMISAARRRIRATKRMNRCSDEQIVKSKQLMSKGVEVQSELEIEPA